MVPARWETIKLVSWAWVGQRTMRCPLGWVVNLTELSASNLGKICITQHRASCHEDDTNYLHSSTRLYMYIDLSYMYMCTVQPYINTISSSGVNQAPSTKLRKQFFFCSGSLEDLEIFCTILSSNNNLAAEFLATSLTFTYPILHNIPDVLWTRNKCPIVLVAIACSTR